MGKPVSTAQSHAVIATFMNNVSWDKLDADTLQRIIKCPKEAGKMFTAVMMRPWTKHLRPFFPAFASIVLAPPERNRRIAEAHDVFSASIGSLFFSSHFMSDGSAKLQQLADVWVMVEEGTAREILNGFNFEEVAFTQSQVVDIADNHDRLLQRGKICIPFKASGVPYIAIIDANARGRLSIHAEHYESDAIYDHSCYFVLGRKQNE